MPHLVFYNLAPSDFPNVEKIEETVSKALISIQELNLTQDDISYTFVKDDTVESEDIPVVIIAELLFEKENRTFEVRQQTARAIGQAFKHTIAKWRKKMPKTVEAAVKRFDPSRDGF